MNTRVRRILIVLTSLILLYTLSGFFLIPYIAQKQAISIAKTRYDLSISIGKIYFNPYTFELEVTDLKVADKQDPLLAFDRFYFNFQTKSLFDKAITFQSLELNQPWMHVALDSTGKLNLAKIAARAPVDATEVKIEDAEQDKAGWPLVIGTLTLRGGAIRFTDKKNSDGFDASFSPLAFSVSNFNTRPAESSELQGFEIGIGEGRLRVSGDFSTIPASLTAALELQGIPLALFQPYVQRYAALTLDSGELRFQGNFSYGTPNQKSGFSITGDAGLSKLNIMDADKSASLLRFSDMAISKLALALEPNNLQIDEIQLTEPTAAIKILPSGKTNLSDILIPQPESESTEVNREEPSNEPAFPIKVTSIKVIKGTMDFADHQIKPNFATLIDQLGGTIDNFSTDPKSEISIKLSGKVQSHGSAEVAGDIAPQRIKEKLVAQVKFGNIELTTFTPYSGKFAGYEIEKGKLFLELDYKLKNGLIRGENKVLLDQFELGDQVESEDAVSLPLKLAVSLLKDRNGKIEIDLPIEGDVNAPDFSIGPLVGRVISNLIVKIVTAPFSFLGNLFGGGDEMEFAEFEAGNSQISVAESEKMLQLAKALTERPQLKVDIQGYADPEADAEKIRLDRFDAKLKAASKDSKISERARMAMVFVATNGEAALTALHDEFTPKPEPEKAPNADITQPNASQEKNKTAPVPDEAALYKAMRERLLATENITKADLKTLAINRAQTVMDVLVAKGKVEGERVFVLNGEVGDPGAGLRTKMILGAK